MKRYSRIPALLVFVLALLGGIAALAAAGLLRRGGASGADLSLPAIERQIVGSADPKLWSLYGQKLSDAGQFASAAAAYKRAAELSPDDTSLQLNEGLALGRAGSANDFFDFVTRLSQMYPKLAADLMARPELSALHADARWSPTQATVQAQALD